jgi:hypothetical protein
VNLQEDGVGFQSCQWVVLGEGVVQTCQVLAGVVVVDQFSQAVVVVVGLTVVVVDQFSQAVVVVVGLAVVVVDQFSHSVVVVVVVHSAQVVGFVVVVVVHSAQVVGLVVVVVVHSAQVVGLVVVVVHSAQVVGLVVVVVVHSAQVVGFVVVVVVHSAQVVVGFVVVVVPMQRSVNVYEAGKMSRLTILPLAGSGGCSRPVLPRGGCRRCGPILPFCGRGSRNLGGLDNVRRCSGMKRIIRLKQYQTRLGQKHTVVVQSCHFEVVVVVVQSCHFVVVVVGTVVYKSVRISDPKNKSLRCLSNGNTSKARAKG